jgi:anthranilate/para-aminobenzoate synthase component I
LYATRISRNDKRGSVLYLKVLRAQEYIAAGDIYQVNLATVLKRPGRVIHFSFYESVAAYSPSPFAAMIALGGRFLLSTSPESFLKISGRCIRTAQSRGDPSADCFAAGGRKIGLLL